MIAASINAEAECGTKNYPIDPTNWPINRPHQSPKKFGTTATVTFDAASTVLTVEFPSNSRGGAVEVFRDGVKVAGITTKGGTTFSCTLRDYGTGGYNVIVSNGNTVIDSKNFTVR